MWAYIIFNVFGALFLYWLTRVPKGKQSAEKPQPAKGEKAAVTTTQESSREKTADSSSSSKAVA